MDNKSYTELTTEALLTEEKKIKNNQFLVAGITGFLIGVIIFGLVKNGFGFLYAFICLLLILLINKNSKEQKQKLVQLREEINKRKQSE